MPVAVEELASVALFTELDATQRGIVAGWLEVEQVPVGRRLTHQGAAGYAFCVLRSGAAEVTVDGAVVRKLGPGDYFGEISMLGDGRQTATITVTAAGVIWRMFGTRFRELQKIHPQIAAAIEGTARARVDRRTN